MNGKLKQLQLQTLDHHLTKIRICNRPSKGWIAAILKSLGMSVRQVAERIGITQQSAASLEANEIEDSITLKSLHKAAEALNCRLVYALVPNDGSLQATLHGRAMIKARDIVSAADQTMQLEAQDVVNLQQKIKEIAKNPNTKLWD
jgi:predicted DNA-binding mobile mystery protein A